MATIATWNAEGGTDGTAVTVANSGGGSGTAFDQFGLGDGTFTYSTVAAHGTLGMHVVHGTVAMIAGWDPTTLGTLTSSYWRWLIRFTGIPTTSQALARFRQTGGATDYVLRIDISGGTTSPGRLRIRNSAGTQVAELGTGLATGIWYRVELDIEHASGSVTLRVYKTDTTTLVTTSGTLTAQSIGASISQVHFGAMFATPQMPPFDLDDIAVKDTSPNPGPVVILPPPPPPPGTFSGWGAAAKIG